MSKAGKCSICAYPDVGQVNRAIMNGMTCRAIEERFRPLSRAAAWRHGRNCLRFDPHKAFREKRITQLVQVYDELVEQLNFAKSLRLECQEYLSDPDDPLMMNFAPRIDEVEVIFYERDPSKNGNGKSATKWIKRSATLDQLLAQVKKERPDIRPHSVRATKKFDMRMFALESIKAVDRILDKFARIEGLYTKDRSNPTMLERAVKAFEIFVEHNPEATEEELRDAVSIMAQAVSVPESELIERLGITFDSEEEQ